MKNASKKPITQIKVHVGYTYNLSADGVRYFCRYTGIDPTDRRRLRSEILGTLEQVGITGLSEMMAEGKTSLEADDMVIER
jgi:hypothetical protein